MRKLAILAVAVALLVSCRSMVEPTDPTLGVETESIVVGPTVRYVPNFTAIRQLAVYINMEQRVHGATVEMQHVGWWPIEDPECFALAIRMRRANGAASMYVWCTAFDAIVSPIELDSPPNLCYTSGAN